MKNKVLRCDLCGVKVTMDNLGWVRHDKDGTMIIRCKTCHHIVRKTRKHKGPWEEIRGS